jgi:hypothetical protein
MKASPTPEAIMSNAEAQKRAIAAINKVYEETDHFEGGSWASGEIINAIKAGIRAEFAKRT